MAGILDKTQHTVTLSTPGPATYGQTTDYGKYGTGAIGARNEAWDQAGHNDQAQDTTAGALGYASAAAATGKGFYQANQDADASNQVAGGAGGNQAGAIELARRMAMGSQPSQAAMQLQSGLNQATAQQRSNAVSARGGAAMATAGSNARANTANLQQNAYTAGGMLKAQDMAYGRGLYGSLASDQRGMDAAQLAEANRMGQDNAASYDKYRLGMGGAAAGFGSVALGQQGSDLDNFNRGMAPVFAQDDMDQQGKEWLYGDRQTIAASNKENE